MVPGEPVHGGVHMKSGKKALLRWLVAAGVTGALLSGAAYAMQRNDCWKCYPCGCANDGGELMCCEGTAC